MASMRSHNPRHGPQHHGPSHVTPWAWLLSADVTNGPPPLSNDINWPCAAKTETLSSPGPFSHLLIFCQILYANEWSIFYYLRKLENFLFVLKHHFKKCRIMRLWPLWSCYSHQHMWFLSKFTHAGLSKKLDTELSVNGRKWAKLELFSRVWK